MYEPGLFHLEGSLEIEDGLAVLHCHHAAGGERFPVSDSVHDIENRDLHVARAQEVRVQRMRPSSRGDRARGCHQGLRGHLPAEDAKSLLVGVVAAKDVHLELLDVEEAKHLIKQRMRQRDYQLVENPASGISSALRSFDSIARHLANTFGSTKFA